MLALSLVAKPSFPESFDIEKNSGSKNADQVVGEIRQLLSKSLNKFKTGENENAAEIAFDAYLTYEKIESNLIAKDKPLGLRLESAFSRYRAEIKRVAPLENVEDLQNEILLDLSKGLELLKNEVGFSGLFIQSFSIIVREGFETILIIAALDFLLKKIKK